MNNSDFWRELAADFDLEAATLTTTRGVRCDRREIARLHHRRDFCNIIAEKCETLQAKASPRPLGFDGFRG